MKWPSLHDVRVKASMVDGDYTHVCCIPCAKQCGVCGSQCSCDAHPCIHIVRVMHGNMSSCVHLQIVACFDAQSMGQI